MMAASLHTDIINSLQRCQDVSIACVIVALCFLIGLYLLRPHGHLWTKQQQWRSWVTTSHLWLKRPHSPSVESPGITSQESVSAQEEWETLSERSTTYSASCGGPAPKGIRRKPPPARLIIRPAPEDVDLPSLICSPPPSLAVAPQALQAQTESTNGYDSSIQVASFPPDEEQPSLFFRSALYEGEVTKTYQNSFRSYKDRRRPVALRIVVCPSDDPRVMQARYADLCTFLTSDILVHIASLIHSIDITFPNSSGFIFESVQHPYDNSVATYLGDTDFHDAMRYKNEFPNLVEFGWSGALGRRRGDGTYAALPAPFHDLLSLPYAQMRRLEFKQCLMTLSDCCLILDSSRKTLETFVVDTVIGTSLERPLPGIPPYPPALWPAAGAQIPVRGYPAFSWVRPDGTCDESELQCEKLTRLELKTTVDLQNFFWMLDAPKLEHFVYEPVGRDLAYITTRNFPWYSIGPALRSLVVRAAGVERDAARELEERCEVEVVELRFCPPSRV